MTTLLQVDVREAAARDLLKIREFIANHGHMIVCPKVPESETAEIRKRCAEYAAQITEIRGRCWIVAEEHATGDIVGCVSVSYMTKELFKSQGFMPGDPRIGDIVHCLVRPDHRGQDVLKACIERLITFARRERLTVVRTRMDPERKDAHALARACGFVLGGKSKGRLSFQIHF